LMARPSSGHSGVVYRPPSQFRRLGADGRRLSVKPIRVGVVCDFREEGWHSMDLIADMLIERLPTVAPQAIAATRLCPPLMRRWSRLPLVGRSARAHLGDRLTGRLWDYPRWLARSEEHTSELQSPYDLVC